MIKTGVCKVLKKLLINQLEEDVMNTEINFFKVKDCK